MSPVILASRSASRAAILKAAGVTFETASPEVDEDAAKSALLAAGAGARQVAEALAEAKAAKVSRQRAGLVIGADQTLDVDGVLYDKARNVCEARERLMALRGRAHQLHAAVVVARDGAAIWRSANTARLTMRAFSDAFLDDYLAAEGETVLSCLGCYRLEARGAQLFESVEGDYFSILGLPLFGLLDFLRQAGALPT